MEAAINSLRSVNLQQGAHRLCRQLRWHWNAPLSDSDLTGLDCAVQLMRHVESFLDKPEAASCPQPDHPLVRLCWKQWAKDDVDSWGLELGLEYGYLEEPFLAVIASATLVQAYWLRPCFLLYQPVEYVRPAGVHTPGWKKGATYTPSACHVEESIFHWSGTEALETHVNQSVGRIPVRDGMQVVRPLRFPTILRVLYTPEPGLEQPPGIAQVRSFRLRSVIDDTRVCRYALIAVVKCGAAGERDFLRLYELSGENIVPQYDGKLPHVDAGWKVGEPGTYMLVYGSMPTGYPVPSVAYPEVPIDDRRKTRKLLDQISEALAEMPDEPATRESPAPSQSAADRWSRPPRQSTTATAGQSYRPPRQSGQSYRPRRRLPDTWPADDSNRRRRS